MADYHQLSNFIWQIADLLRGDYRPPQYERVMLPLTVLRRFDCILAPTKAQVLAEVDRLKAKGVEGNARESALNRVAGKRFHNSSPLDFEKLKADPQKIDQHLLGYIQGFSEDVRIIFQRFEFENEIQKMNDGNILYLIISAFCDVNLHPDVLDNFQMGLLFEDLIRRFNEAANETAGDHFTPRDVIKLMVDILFEPDDEILTTQGKIYKLLDPTCGTGGMLSEAQKHLHEMNSGAQLYVFGQDINPRSYAIAASDLLMRSNPNNNVMLGDTLVDDQFPDQKFDYFLANPPFGVDWKKQYYQIQDEHQKLGKNGRFGAGLPRVSDGALLFLQHMVSKFENYRPIEGKNGSRLAVVLNGSPLFTGGAGSGESEIRKWIIENDMLETIIALPEQMFFNTGIATYIWIVTNRKAEERKGRIQLIDARERWQPLRRTLGNKRRELSENHIAEIIKEYGDGKEGIQTLTSKIFPLTEFGYQRVQIDRPLRLAYQMNVERKGLFLDAFPHLLDDVQAIDRKFGRQDNENWNDFKKKLVQLLEERSSRWKAKELKEFRKVFTKTEPEAIPVVAKIRKAVNEAYAHIWGWFDYGYGQQAMYEPDSDLRDFENIDLVEISSLEETVSKENLKKIVDYVEQEVIVHVEDAWAERESIRSAYEINFNRYFYTYTPPRPLAEIDADIKALEDDIVRMLREITE